MRPRAASWCPGTGTQARGWPWWARRPASRRPCCAGPSWAARGKNLDEFLSLTGLKRPQLYITNAVKFRPVRQTQRGQANRPPTREEIELFRPWLLKELGLVRPRLVASLGNVPLLALTAGEPPSVSCTARCWSCRSSAARSFPSTIRRP